MHGCHDDVGIGSRPRKTYLLTFSWFDCLNEGSKVLVNRSFTPRLSKRASSKDWFMAPVTKSHMAVVVGLTEAICCSSSKSAAAGHLNGFFRWDIYKEKEVAG